MSKIEIRCRRDKNGCWICISHIWKNKKGYPRIERNGKSTTMSRYMYEKYKSKIPDGLMIRHTCDNPNCINPSHLITGTNQDNMDDMKKRNKDRKIGEKHPFSKLKEKQVKEILKSEDGPRHLGREYGVAHTTIIRIKQRKHWRNVEVDAL